MANVRPISYVGSSPAPPPNTVRINYRHNDWSKDKPWLSIDFQKAQLFPPDLIPTLLHKAFDKLSRSKTRILSLDDELDLARPSREVGITELDTIIRTQSVLAGGEKNKLDVTIHDEVREPVPVGELERQAGVLVEQDVAKTQAKSATDHVAQKREKEGGLNCACCMS